MMSIYYIPLGDRAGNPARCKDVRTLVLPHPVENLMEGLCAWAALLDEDADVGRAGYRVYAFAAMAPGPNNWLRQQPRKY